MHQTLVRIAENDYDADSVRRNMCAKYKEEREQRLSSNGEHKVAYSKKPLLCTVFTNTVHNCRCINIIFNMLRKHNTNDISSCTDCQHHDIVPEGLHHIFHNQNGIPDFTTIYNLYLTAACSGIDHTFGDINRDPMYATDIKSLTLRRHILTTNCGNAQKRVHYKCLDISAALRADFRISSKRRQLEILKTLEFEYRNVDIGLSQCPVCHGVFMNSTNTKKGKTSLKRCEHCTKTRSTSESDLINKNFLPIWTDSNGSIRYDLPSELQDLSLAERLLIQKIAVLIPVVHMYQGQLGLNGHSVMFRKDLSVLCNELPRIKVDLIHVIREINLSDGSSGIQNQIFTVRRKKVLAALFWLKKFHTDYRNITIVEENLDWIGTGDEGLLGPTNVVLHEQNTAKTSTIQHESVAEAQTDPVTPGATVQTYGTARSTCSDSHNPENIALIAELKKSVNNKKQKIPSLMFPQIDTQPIDEYSIENVFAQAYPWLFPGGKGDASSECGDKLSLARRWSQTLLRYEDGRFMRDDIFTFHLYNYIQRHVNNKNASYFYNKTISDRPTVTDIKRQIARGDLSFVKKIQQFASSMRGSDGWWRSRKHEVDSWVTYHIEQKHGPPSLFMTFSCAEYWWPDLQSLLYQRCKGTEDESLAEAMVNGDTDKARIKAKRILIDSYAAIIEEFFQLRVDNWMETIGKDIFNINHYYLRFEFAKGRGQIHAHILAITTDFNIMAQFYTEYACDGNEGKAASTYGEYARNVLSLTGEKPDGDIDTNDNELKPLSTRFCEAVSTKNDLAKLVEDAHMHKCNNFCLRSKKRRCVQCCFFISEMSQFAEYWSILCKKWVLSISVYTITFSKHFSLLDQFK